MPVIGVPSGMQPRAAVVYMTIATLQCAAAAGVCESLLGEAEGSRRCSSGSRRSGGRTRPADSAAKALAPALDGTIPIVYGAGLTARVAERWKTQINENAKQPAFAAILPEANHNDICAWERADDVRPASPPCCWTTTNLHPQLRRRIELTAERRRRPRPRGPAVGANRARARAVAGLPRRPGVGLHGRAGRRRPDAGRGARALQGQLRR